MNGRGWPVDWLRKPQTISLVDQVLSGGSNFVGVVLIAGSMSAAAFGVFAFSFTTLTLLLALIRAWVGTRIMLAAGSNRQARHVAVSGAFSAILLVSPLVSIAVAVSFLVAATSLDRSGVSVLFGILVVLAAPIICAQDTLRYSAMTMNRPGVAAWSDLAWFAVVVFALLSGSVTSPVSAIGFWMSGALLGLLIAWVGVAPVLSLRLATAFMRVRSAIGEAVVAGAVLVNIALFVVMALAIHFVGQEAAGSLRAAGTLLGPINVLLSFVDLALVGYLTVRARREDVRWCMRVAVMLMAVTAIWGCILLNLPQHWGEMLLGDTWSGTRVILPWTVVEYVFLGALAAAVLGLKVRHQAVAFLRTRLLFVALALLSGTSGAAIVGETGAIAAALAFTVMVTALFAWALLVRSSSDGRS